ncbi:hypothetical protein BJ741DRAFT_647611 [Chytriomyces cf. hyalinus JEL632]|nr:hypothetical protein BJ741DRAFT_647611 [Chytriomyces cf. hyalinus JEL632]
MWQILTYTFLDINDEIIPSGVRGRNILDSITDYVTVPPKARSMKIAISTNSPLFCIARYHLYLNTMIVLTILCNLFAAIVGVPALRRLVWQILTFKEESELEARHMNAMVSWRQLRSHVDSGVRKKQEGV